MYAVQKLPGPAQGGFQSCKLKYSGDGDVNEFISEITIFKLVNKINDVTALQDLHLVLDGEAAHWWSTIKSSEFGWSEFNILLKSRFSKKLPIQQIYQKLNEKQLSSSNSTYFIAKKRALIAHLPESFTEMYQVNLVTNLLRTDIKSLFKRNFIATFKDLYDEVENAEKILKNKKTVGNHVKESNKVKNSRKIMKNKNIRANHVADSRKLVNAGKILKSQNVVANRVTDIKKVVNTGKIQDNRNIVSNHVAESKNLENTEKILNTRKSVSNHVAKSKNVINSVNILDNRYIVSNYKAESKNIVNTGKTLNNRNIVANGVAEIKKVVNAGNIMNNSNIVSNRVAELNDVVNSGKILNNRNIASNRVTASVKLENTKNIVENKNIVDRHVTEPVKVENDKKIQENNRIIGNHVTESNNVKKSINKKKKKKKKKKNKNKLKNTPMIEKNEVIKYSHSTQLCLNQMKSKFNTSLQIQIVNNICISNTSTKSQPSFNCNNLNEHQIPVPYNCVLTNVVNERTDFTNDIVL